MREGERSRHTNVDALRRRDEVLQILFWMSGEGFEAEMTTWGVARFLMWPVDEVRAALEDAGEAGLLEAVDEAGSIRYELTQLGRQEGARRFVDEFAPMLARDAHAGACSDPNCDCHTSPQAAAACASERPSLKAR
jgi:quinol monooxygenase YgiN